MYEKDKNEIFIQNLKIIEKKFISFKIFNKNLIFEKIYLFYENFFMKFIFNVISYSIIYHQIKIYLS